MNKTFDIVNRQIGEEFYSAYVYLALAGRLESWGLKGAANWMKVQAREEEDHAMGFFRFLLERGEEPVLPAISQPDVSKVKNVLDAFLAGLSHEKHITGTIHAIYEAARENKDYALESFIKWYIDEQVEEEANANEIIDRLKLVGSDGPSLYLLDQELGARLYTPSGPYAAGGEGK